MWGVASNPIFFQVAPPSSDLYAPSPQEELCRLLGSPVPTHTTDDWRHCDCAVGLVGGVGRDGRAQQPAKLLLGRWSIQVTRRRENLEEDGIGSDAPHRANRDSSEES